MILYKVNGANGQRGPLSEPLAEGVADEAGRFAITLNKFQPGDTCSKCINTEHFFGIRSMNHSLHQLMAPTEL
ncbi:hypothetical protein [Acaryochloris sp. IP29b_bin.148]|uniref:hypothetical protein n=1 Tax=Acaryochloris sp. IP29b_bin.148 TaxID=2969218 RepID=UPI002635360F|nr:hypothetical protein [Acaryochloris sp. IP29b_bin.148]